jgi:hypothetical protein
MVSIPIVDVLQLQIGLLVFGGLLQWERRLIFLRLALIKWIPH